jgi:alpha-1,3-rhamnosyltransferase
MNDKIVSVVVLTYNSEKTIRETIESILAQTYRQIEIVISDDCSTDETFAIIESIDFGEIPYKCVSTEKNCGVAGNANNGLRNASGTYIKLIAGDDLLFPEAIEEYLHYFKENEICVANIQCFGDSVQDNKRVERYFGEKKEFYSLPQKKQYNYLIKENPICAVAVGLISKSLYKKMGYYDEDYPFMEDYPFWMKASKNGITFRKIERPLVKYRISVASLSGSNRKGVTYYCARDFFWKVRVRQLLIHGNWICLLKNIKYYLI